MDGNCTFAHFNNASQSFQYLPFELLGIHTVINDTDLNFQAPTGWASTADIKIQTV
jgi:hypothetical protein